MRWLYLSLLSAMLLGCQAYNPKKHNELLQQKPICCTGINALPYKSMQPEQTLDISLDENSPVFSFKEGRHFFQAFQLPTWQGALQLTFTTRASTGSGREQGIIKPIIKMLDANYQTTRILTPSVEKHWFNNRFEFTVFINPENADEHYVVVHPEMSGDQVGGIHQSYSPVQVGHGILLVPVTVGGATNYLSYRSAALGSIQMRVRPYGWSVAK